MKTRGITMCAAAAAVAVGVGTAGATVYDFNTSNGTLSVSGGSATGGAMKVNSSSSGEEFDFSGDVTFNTGDVINVAGPRPLIISSYNDITLGAYVTINVSASGTQAGPGGGDGGTGGAGSAGGAGGVPPLTGILTLAGALNGGVGGSGGGSYGSGGDGQVGGSGAGFDGTAGGAGIVGSPGSAGTPAYSSSGAAAPGSGGGSFGQGGLPGVNGVPGGGGSGGSITASISGAHLFPGSPGGNGTTGANGGNGIAGAMGNSGADGTNLASLTLLTGGNGGAGGGGGQGGGGGGTGGVGGGGGGGGGGASSLLGGGGAGGDGGAGGLGGAGGNGGTGGAGGNGGGGGGAVELFAMGRLTVDGAILAQGAGGHSGLAGSGGGNGSYGGKGLNGQPGGGGSHSSASGGSGGYGGYGGQGGNGGAGGNGGNGGAGAGGTIILKGSAVLADQGTFDTLGGGSAATNGKFFIATNSQISPIRSTQGALPSYTPGTSGPNYFAQTPTPNIPDLVGGVAAPYGVLANLQANSPALAGLAQNAPANALAAVLLGSSGLPGYSDVYPGYQWVFVVNLSGKAIDNLNIGLSSNSTTFATSLMQQSISTGSGSFKIVTSSGIPLPGNDIYAFLAPTTLIDSGTLYATANGATPLTMTSDYGLVTPGFLPVGYLQSNVVVPEPAAWMIALAGMGALALLPRRSRAL